MNDLILEARQQFEKLYDESKDRKDAFKEDMSFAHNVGDGQWNSADVSDRDENKRPHITSNKLGKFVVSVVNQERGNPDRDQVIPVDDKGDIAIAKIYNDLIRDIEYQSEFDDVCCLSGEHAASGGYGFWRILTEYADDGFDQEIKIKAIKNPLLVELDPRGNHGFIRECMTIDEFKRLWPGKETKADFESDYNDELWYEEDKIWVAEWFRKVPYKKTIAEILPLNATQPMIVEITDENEEEVRKHNVMRERTMTSYKVEWYKMSGSEILEEGEWVGSEIPIIEVVGHEIYLDGHTYKKSLIRDVKDMNRLYNYWLTSMTEKVALSPKAPYLVTPQQIQGHEKLWKQANTANLPYLTYNSTNSGIPTRTPAATVEQGELTMLNLAANDIRDILGIYEASSGQTSNERSGKAIMARAARSDLTTFNFPDNLRRAKLKTRKQLIEIIPKIYDTARVVRLRNKDERVQINFVKFNPETGDTTIINDLSQGRYDIRYNVQGHPSRRQQIVEDLVQLLQYTPKGYHDIILQQLLKFMDTEGAEEFAQAIAQRTQQLQQEQLILGEENG